MFYVFAGNLWCLIGVEEWWEIVGEVFGIVNLFLGFGGKPRYHPFQGIPVLQFSCKESLTGVQRGERGV